MTKKLTITVSDEVYKGLHRRVGRRKISRFIDELARERLGDRNSPEYWLTASDPELAAAYAEQAAYETAQTEQTKDENKAWLDGLIGDVLRTDRSDAKG
jgi:predicted CopG family antitoxin